MRSMNNILCAFIGSLIVDYFDDIHSKNLGKHIKSLYFLFNMLQNKLLHANLLHWENYSPFKIVYGLTLLDLIYLLILIKEFDLIAIEKVQVMKALFNKAQQHVEKNNEKHAF